MKYLALLGILASLAGLLVVAFSFGNESKYQSTPSTTLPKPAIQEVATTTEHVSEEIIETQQKEVVEAPKPTPPLMPPQGARWHNLGGIARSNCAAIVDPIIQEICTQEVAIEQYIRSIVPSAVVTKGFCYPGTSFADPKNWQQCTDLNNLRTKTVHALKNIFEKIVAHCSARGITDCAIIVTGGSEFGHKGEAPQADGSIACIDEQSHCAGRKVDLRLTKGLESLVVTTMTPLPIRDFDGAPQWLDPETNYIYAKEPTHWDILVP